MGCNCMLCDDVKCWAQSVSQIYQGWFAINIGLLHDVALGVHVLA